MIKLMVGIFLGFGHCIEDFSGTLGATLGVNLRG